MKIPCVKGATSVLVRIFIADSSSTTGAGLTGLVFNTSGLVCYRMRDDDGNAGATAISLATATLGTWTSGGLKEKDATNAPGWYEFGIPNAALATGTRTVDIHLKGATNMAPLQIEILLTGPDDQDAVRGGMTALPNTVCTTNASLLTSGTGTDQISNTSGRVDVGKALGTAVTLDSNNVLNVSAKYLAGTALTGRDIGASVLLSPGTGTGQISLASGAVTVGTNNDKTGYSLSQSFPANFSSLGISAGGHINNVDVLTTYTGDTPQSGDCFARIGATGSGLSSLAQASTALSNANWTNGRAANLDNLDRAITAIMTTALTESARALHAMPTPSQALQEILQNIVASSFSGLTKTAHKLSDGTTPTKTYTVDANPPTAIVEAS